MYGKAVDPTASWLHEARGWLRLQLGAVPLLEAELNSVSCEEAPSVGPDGTFAELRFSTISDADAPVWPERVCLETAI